MALQEVLDLKKAYRRVQQDKNDDTWPDIVGYRDYGRFLDENLNILQERLVNPASYEAKLPLGIDLPKRGFTLRPGLVPLIDDRIIYQGLADLFAPHYTAEPCVFSNLLSSDQNSSQLFIPGVQLWLKFQKAIEKNCENYSYVVETDLTAYFDHISHDILLHRLDDLFVDHLDKGILRESKQLLHKLWRRWSPSGHRFGIPQVNNASSFFGNLYLDELDKWMLRHGYNFLRYVDDFRIFVEDEPNARKALAELIIKLREMGLFVGTAKTAIKRTQTVIEEMIDGRQKMDVIETELNFKTRDHLEIGGSLLEAFFNQIIDDQDHFNDRHFRYCVNRFKKLRVNGIGDDIHSHVAEQVLNRFISMPHASDTFVDYLSLFPVDEKVQMSILEFLESPYNIYPWQEMLLLELFIRFDILPSLRTGTTNIARSIATNQQKHPACRAKAFILLGKNGDYADIRDIRSCFSNEAREDIRRSILCAIQGMQLGERNHFYENIAGQSNSIRMTADYLTGLSRPTYHYYNPPSGYELIEVYEESDDLDELNSEDFLY